MATKREQNPKAGQGEPPVAGRPTRYGDEIAREICDRLSQGETLASICKDEHMPAAQVVHGWRHRHPTFYDRYTRAREEQMRAWADQITELADDAEADHSVTISLDDPRLEVIHGTNTITFKFDRTHVERAKLQIGTRQWLMERLLSEDYAQRQKIDVNHQVDHLDEDNLLREIALAMRLAEVTVGDLHRALLELDEADVIDAVAAEVI